jgi:2-polyprenyl-3-methyl-5-hydroxy-6-metoxy-1,4-benzoquinol methylase
MPGETWVAYRQFCQHFLGPLCLMAEKDPRLNILLCDFIDGIPLPLVSQLLPTKTKFNLSILTHIHLHALNQKRMANKKIDKKKYQMTKFQMASLINSLRTVVEKLKMKNFQTEWKEYYSFTNYSHQSSDQKQKLLGNFLSQIKPKSVLDLGANEGKFSQIACQKGAYTITCDIDPLSIEKAYLKNKKKQNKRLLPLVIDLTNPSPAIGWLNNERKSFNQRARADCVIALALIHHLAISNNLPLVLIAQYFAGLGDFLIIEFVPKGDSNAKILLQNRKDIFSEYSKEGFEKAFSDYFQILAVKNIKGSQRDLYLMKKNDQD